MALTRICVARGKNYFTFLCEGIKFMPKKQMASVVGGEYGGTLIYGVDGVCVEKCIKKMRGSKVKLDGSIFYAEKDGKEIKLIEESKAQQMSLF